jgi:nuclear transport factor 2 (NTF2) superfamily protein
MRRMRLLSCALLWHWASFAWALDPEDPRLRTPTGHTFVRYCSSLLGGKPYQISVSDPRAKTVRNFYALLNRGKLQKALDLYAENSVYRNGAALYVGKTAIGEQLFSSMDNRFGQFSIRDVSWKNHQLLVHGKFEGTHDGGALFTVEFLELWVVDRSGKVYYHHSTLNFASERVQNLRSHTP